jgi:hypothetical protein
LNPPSQSSFHGNRCREIAAHLRSRSLWTAILAVVTLIFVPPVLLLSGSAYPLTVAGLSVVSSVSALAACCISALLKFDSALFDYMASHGPDAAGAAVDAFLARAELKSAPAATRTFEERVTGTHRLMRRQLACLALMAISTLLALSLTIL